MRRLEVVVCALLAVGALACGKKKAEPEFTVGGTVAGLVGSGLRLHSSLGDDLDVTGDGPFTFATTAPEGTAFEVTVAAQPTSPWQTCTITGGTGEVGAADATTVAVTCTTNTYAVGGSVTGLVGSGLVLRNSGGNDLPVGVNGSFIFTTPVASGATYAVEVFAQPTSPWQTCTVTNDGGTVTSAAIETVSVTCTTNTYAIKGDVEGLLGDGLVLRQAGADDLPIAADGPFVFATEVASGTGFDVSVATPPTDPWQTCVVSGGTGTVLGDAVSAPHVTCTTDAFPIQVAVEGLRGGGLVLQQGDDLLPVLGDGSYSFATPVPSGAGYEVAIAAQPTSPWQTCEVTFGAGNVLGEPVAAPHVACTTNAYDVHVQVSGLAGGGLVLLQGGGDDLPVPANGTFTFPTRVASGDQYDVTVGLQPTSPWQTCLVEAGTGPMEDRAVTIQVACTTNTYAIGGVAAGILGAGVTLEDAGAGSVVVTSPGRFTFPTPLASGGSYAASVAARSDTLSCTLERASGDVTSAAIDDVGLTCACATGRDNCDGDASNACETDLTQPATCGSCSNACPAGNACCASGCADLMTDTANCGACGNACAAGSTCCSGTCYAAGETAPCGTACGAPCQSAGTSGEDFGAGTSDQLAPGPEGLSTIPSSQNPPPSASPYIWIAMHNSNTVNKLDAKTGAALGSYSSRGTNPSRGVTALDGSYWVGNRCPNDPNNGACSNVAQILPDGTAGCTVSKAADGQPLPFLRALAIDKNGYIWAGSWNDARAHKIDPKTCTTILDVPMNKNGFLSYPYGFAVDRNGVLWNSNLGSGNGVMGIDTVTGNILYTVSSAGNCFYGITIDRNNNVFYGQCGPCNGGAFRLDGATHALSTVAGTNGRCSNGIAVDLQGNILIAQPGAPSTVTKLAGGSGAYLATWSFADVQYGYGIAADVYGKVWFPGSNNNRVVRLNPLTGVQELSQPLAGSWAYTYSDWNGLSLRTVTCNNAQAGTWKKVYDGGNAVTTWHAASWNATVPTGAFAKLSFKAAAAADGFAGVTSCGPFFASPVDLTACNFGEKQFLEVTVSLETNDVDQRPVVSDLNVWWQN